MSDRDEFEDPAVSGAVRSIFRALDSQGRLRPRGRGLAGGLIAALLVFAGSVMWYSYPRERAVQELEAIPIVRADAGPYKVVPKDPGGMDIPYRNSTVFETLREADASDSGKVEHLLPESEKPVARENLFAGLNVKLQAEPPAVKPAVKPETEKQETETAAAAAAAGTEPAAGVETSARADTPPDRMEEGGFFVQIASVRSEADAQAAWTRMKMEFSALSGLGHRVSRAELGERGTYFRLQAGPVSEARARSLCGTIETKKPGGCLVVRR